jgi:hypothetical protein
MMSLTDGIVGCWSPSLGASGYRLLDRSQYSNHGTLTNMDSTDWTATPVGLGLDFDGSNDFVNCGARGGALTNSIPFSVSVWAFARSVSVNAGLVSRDQNSPFAFSFRSTNVVSLVTDGAILTGSAWVLNEWRHYVCTLAPSLRRIYVQARQDAESTSLYTVTSNTESLYIGADYLGGTANRTWDGQIGEVAIYNRALTAQEVFELYRRGNGAIGRELIGQTRTRQRGSVLPSFRPYWALQQNQIIGGGLR